jgi:hypothetical protein
MRKEEEHRIEAIHGWFAEHVATVHESKWPDTPVSVTMVDFRSPGTGQYSMRFLLCGHKLFVTGDIVDAVFSLTEEASLKSLANYDTTYLYEKMSCIDDLEKGFDFSRDVAVEDIQNYFADKDDWFEKDSPEWKATVRREQRLLAAAKDCIGFADWQQAVEEEYEDDAVCDPEEMSLVFTFGSVYSYGFLAIQEGLRMAKKQLCK